MPEVVVGYCFNRKCKAEVKNDPAFYRRAAEPGFDPTKTGPWICSTCIKDKGLRELARALMEHKLKWGKKDGYSNANPR